MAIDTPARLAIVGAGPIGLECALYARFLGYDVDVFEQGTVAEHVRRWAHVRMFTPFGQNRSTLGLAAIAAQDSAYRPPSDEQFLTGHEWLQQYLEPLAHSDLLSDHVQTHSQVVAIGRPAQIKGQFNPEQRRDQPFRVLIRTSEGHEQGRLADAVIDTTGVYGQPNWLGAGGIPAIGETALRSQIEYGLPDVLGRARDQYAGRCTLVVGDGSSAATTVVALAALGATAADTRVVWVTQRRIVDGAGPVVRLVNDPLEARDALSAEANRIAQRSAGPVECLAGWSVDSISRSSDSKQFVVRLVAISDESAASDHDSREVIVDRIVGQVGYRPDHRLSRELHVEHCALTEAPRGLADELSGGGATHRPSAESLACLEPDFYLLGAKSYGRRSDFLFATGLAQIRRLFAILGDRPTLDLYASALPRP